MRLAIVGNSHIGCLKRAWDAMQQDRPALDPVFFGARGKALGELRPEGDALVPTTGELAASLRFTSGGRDRIRPDEFDAVLIFGTEAYPLILNPRYFYSDQVLARAARDITEPYLYFGVLKQLRAVSARPIFIGHAPLTAAARNGTDQSIEPYLNGLAFMNRAVFAPLGARMVAQPAATIVNGNRTSIEFAKGSRRLAIGDGLDDTPHPEEDVGHMNERFGEIWLRAFLAGPDTGTTGSPREAERVAG